VVKLTAWAKDISEMYGLGLWLTQPSVRRAVGALPCGYSSQGMKLDPHLYVELSLIMDGSKSQLHPLPVWCVQKLYHYLTLMEAAWMIKYSCFFAVLCTFSCTVVITLAHACNCRSGEGSHICYV
jgi:hypothetical protein